MTRSSKKCDEIDRYFEKGWTVARRKVSIGENWMKTRVGRRVSSLNIRESVGLRTMPLVRVFANFNIERLQAENI